MKVEMRADGMIGIKAENGCESFALGEWANRIEWNSAIDAGVRLYVETDGATDVKEERRAEPMRDRLARAERALKRAGYTYLEGAAEWKPPVGRAPHKEVSVIYHGSDGIGWRDHSIGPSAEHIAKLYDGGVVVVQQEDETVRVSVMTKQDVKPTSGRYRESDIAAMSAAIVDQVREHCGLWDRWPGSDVVARVAYDALYTNVAKR